MNWLSHLFQNIIHFFNSDKVKAIEKQIEALTPAALQLVQAISLAVPNKTLTEVVKAYELYGVPLVHQVNDDAVGIGNAMLNLATAILAKQSPSTATNILNTVIQLAVTLSKAK